jgi:signal transduction protein with GAF and PtsI domain
MLDPAARQQFLTEVRAGLAGGGTTEANLHAVLDRVLLQFECATGTIHALDPALGQLRLRAQRGIPRGLMDRVVLIPIGKGMAGIAAERRQPVQVCNLQTDASGVARAGARETRMEGSVAVPMLVGESLRGVLGVAKPVAYDFSEAETSFLLEIAAAIGACLAHGDGAGESHDQADAAAR